MRSIFGKKNELSSAIASVAGENGEHDDAGAIDNQIGALEDHAEGDPAMQAAEALEGYTLTPGAKSLLDRALDNIATNDGANIDDPEFKLTVQARSALIDAAGNDLTIAIACLVDAMREEPKSIANVVQSLCYNVLKQAVFYANLDYRRYLDPRGDFDLLPYMRSKDEFDRYEPMSTVEALGTDGEFAADQREELRDAPPGLDNSIDREWGYFREVYGTAVEVTEDVFAAALTDLRVYLQLTAEAFGWDPQRPMAFANIAEKDGTFTPITDAAQALDHTEVQRKVRRREAQAKDNARMLAAAERAKAALGRAGARKTQ